MVGPWFLRLSCVLLVATMLPCAVVLCLCTQLPVGSGDVILDKFEFSPSIRVQASGSWHCVACFSAIWIALVCVCLVGMAKSFFQGLQALVGRFASLASAWAAFVGIITFFTSACAAAAWPLAIVNLMMFEYAAFLVLYRVFISVSAAVVRLLALLGVILKCGSSGACSAKVKSVWLLFGVLPRVVLWDASCQSVPGLGYSTLGFFFSAAAVFIVIAIVIMLWKCCSLCSGSCKEWKKESLLKLVEKKQIPSLSLQVASWFTAPVMARCNSVWAALVCNVVANHSVLEEGMFIVCSVMDQCRRTSLVSIWHRLLLLAFFAARVSSCFVGMFWDFAACSCMYWSVCVSFRNSGCALLRF